LRDVIDLDSAIDFYKVDEKKTRIITELAEKNVWRHITHGCPDGTYLYYCSAPVLWEDRDQVPPGNFNQMKYHLMRISYDLEADQWGESETVLSADETGMCIQEIVSSNVMGSTIKIHDIDMI